MPIFEKIRNIFGSGGDNKKKIKQYTYIKRDVDPGELWDIVGELGDGAFGKVYKAQNKERTIEAALKQVDIKDELELDEYSVEIDILSTCRHKNIVGIFEAYYFNSKLCMYIEFCGGGAVDSIMQELEKALTEPQIRCLCHEMCEAIDFLHQHFIIHRDLKAGNVLLTADGHVRLADFGVSAKNANMRQRRDSFIGTPYWMAPEVILCETIKDSPYNYKADIWSFGITLIEFAEIDPPNHEIHPMRVFVKIQKSLPPTLKQPSKWSNRFSDFIAKCLVKDPENRPCASELLQHAFIRDVQDMQPLVALVSEANAEVVYEEKDVDEDDASDTESVMDVDFDTLSVTSEISKSEVHETRHLGTTDKEDERHTSTNNKLVPASPKLARKDDAASVSVSALAVDKHAIPVQQAVSPDSSRLPTTDINALQSAVVPSLDVHTLRDPVSVVAEIKAPLLPVINIDEAANSAPVDYNQQLKSVEVSEGTVPPTVVPAEEPISKGTDTDLVSIPALSTVDGISSELPVLSLADTELPAVLDKSVESVVQQSDVDETKLRLVEEVANDQVEVTKDHNRSATTCNGEDMGVKADATAPNSKSVVAAEVLDETTQVGADLPAEQPFIQPAPDVKDEGKSCSESEVVMNDKSGQIEPRRIDEVIGMHDDTHGQSNDNSSDAHTVTLVEKVLDGNESLESTTKGESKELDNGANLVTVEKDSENECEKIPVAVDVSPVSDSLRAESKSDEAKSNDTSSATAEAAADQNAGSMDSEIEKKLTSDESVESSVKTDGEDHLVESEQKNVCSDVCVATGVTDGSGSDKADLQTSSSYIQGELAESKVLIPGAGDALASSSVNSAKSESVHKADGDHIVDTVRADCLVKDEQSNRSLVADVKETVVCDTSPDVTGDATRPSVVIENSTNDKPDVNSDVADVCNVVVSLEDSTATNNSVISDKGSTSPDASAIDDNNAIGKDRMYVRKEVKKKISSESSESISKLAEGNVDAESTKAAVHRNGESDEPAVVLRHKHKPNIVITEEAEEAKKQRSKARKTLTKTRKFVVNGVVMTSQTSRVVGGDDIKKQQEHELWKADLHELKRLHLQENRQLQAMSAKATAILEEQFRKMELDMQNMLRAHDNEIDQLMKQYRQMQEKLSTAQLQEFRAMQKKVKMDQDRDLKAFHKGLKQDMELMKQSVDMLPKEMRKDALRQRKEEKDTEQAQKVQERSFLEKQAEDLDKAMKRLSEQHREKVALCEKQFLQQKHQVKRGHKTAILDLEERQLQEKCQLSEHLLKESFILKRQLLMTRNAMEVQQIKRINTQKEDELLQNHALERKRLPKILKSDTKTRALMFRESLRISAVGVSVETERERIKQFDEKEKIRVKQETLRLESKQRRQWDELKAKNDAIIKELEQVYLDKQNMLLENEKQKLTEMEKKHKNELEAWRDKIESRKQEMEEEFALELVDHEKVYSSGDGGCPPYTASVAHRLTVCDAGKSASGNRHSMAM